MYSNCWKLHEREVSLALELMAVALAFDMTFR